MGQGGPKRLRITESLGGHKWSAHGWGVEASGMRGVRKAVGSHALGLVELRRRVEIWLRLEELEHGDVENLSCTRHPGLPLNRGWP